MLAAVLAAGTLASCGDSVLDSVTGEGRRDGKRGDQVATVRQAHDPPVNGNKPQPDKKDARQTKSGDNGKGNGADDRTAATDESQPADATAVGTDTKADTGATKPAVACSSDMPGDMDSAGSAPSYADLTNGCVREQGDGILLQAATAGTLPARMPDGNTNLAIAFTFERGSGPKTYVTAESTADGWTAYLNRGGRQQTLPAPTVSGKQLTVTIPASVVTGEVSWRVESSWLRSTLTTTSYAFDDAPNGGTSSFRGR